MKPNNNPQTTTFKRYTYNRVNSLTVIPSRSNCKVSFLDSIAMLSTNPSSSKLFDEFLSKDRRLCYHMTTTGGMHEKVVRMLKNAKCKIIYDIPIPIGYNGKPQHHICITNNCVEGSYGGRINSFIKTKKISLGEKDDLLVCVSKLKTLTIDKLYRICHNYDGKYWVINDNGRKTQYLAKNFKRVKLFD